MWIRKDEIAQYLPHREPFLFIDSVEKMELEGEKSWDGKNRLDFKELINSRVFANYKTCAEHPIFKGHFPERPILPGVIQIEIMAQTGAFTLVPALFPYDKSNVEVAFLSVVSAKFRAPVYPEMNLAVEAMCTRLRYPLISHKSRIFCSGELMSEASTLCSIKSHQER